LGIIQPRLLIIYWYTYGVEEGEGRERKRKLEGRLGVGGEITIREYCGRIIIRTLSR
jgi:hypothetical protein